MDMAAGWVYPFIPKTDMLTESKSGLTDSCRHFHTYTHISLASSGHSREAKRSISNILIGKWNFFLQQ